MTTAMKNDNAATVAINEVYAHYGHDIDNLTPLVVTKWKMVHAQYRLDYELSRAVMSEMMGEHDVIPKIDDVLPLFTAVAGRMRATKTNTEELASRPSCPHCRGKGWASVFSRKNPANTVSVICFCDKGQEVELKTQTVNGKRPFSGVTNIQVRDDIQLFTACHDNIVKAWAKEAGLADAAGRFLPTDEFREKFRAMTRQSMFRDIDGQDTEQARKSAKRLSEILRVRPLDATEIPDGWEAVGYTTADGFYRLKVVGGMVQPDPNARVQKRR